MLVDPLQFSQILHGQHTEINNVNTYMVCTVSFYSFSTTNLRVRIRVVCRRETEPLRARQRATFPSLGNGLHLVDFAFNATEASHGIKFSNGFRLGLPRRDPKQSRIEAVFRCIPGHLGSEALYGAMLRGELPHAALSLAHRNFDDIPLVADAAFWSGATRAALLAQVEHESKIKQEAREALVRDSFKRIASTLASAMRPKAGFKLRKLQSIHALTMFPSMYDGV
eukprot:3496007-Pleurochrysis_carterae.AAC.4